MCVLLAWHRFRDDCRKLAYFVHRIEALITETEDSTDMTAPGWEDAFNVGVLFGVFCLNSATLKKE